MSKFLITIPNKRRIVITAGEPAGIGPDLIAMMAQLAWPIELVICADPALLTARARELQLPLRLHPYQQNQPASPRPAGELTVMAILAPAKVIPGKLNPSNSRYVIATLARACDSCLNKEFAAMITGPVHKGIINDAGLPFSGHTEFFAKRSGRKRVVMLMTNDTLRIALATTHLPLLAVPKAITRQSLHEMITILIQDLRRYFGIPQPRIYICGLNPHAGEGGHIGREEIEVIIPALNRLRDAGYDLTGPLPADTLFQPKYLQHADAVMAMYHDQGLPVIKYQGFGRTVNITLGLPFIRTSVDHGTAIELAGTGQAKADSIKTAINLTINMINNHNE